MDRKLICTPQQKSANFAVLGGKGKNLYLLSNQGIPVPRWFCITSDAFEIFMKAHGPVIEKILVDVDYKSFAAIEKISKKIYDIFVKSESFLELEREVESSLENDMKDGKYFSVRSSALGEDSAKDSFAGQLETFLYVKPHQIIEYVKKCWASAFGARVLSYIHARGGNPNHTKVAVVVQEMFESRKSGVFFTANPQGVLHEMIIVAGLGLGEGIVSDQVESDTIIYNKFDKSFSKRLNQKEWQIQFDSEKGFGTVRVPVPTELQNQPALEEQELRQLLEMGQKVEAYYKQPQDIEWGINAQGELAILQSRPITTLPRGEKVLFDNSNISESYPGITLPLTYSFIREAYELIFKAGTLLVGVNAEQVNEKIYAFKNLVSLLNGRVFYNLSNWYTMFRLVPGGEKYVSVWEEMMGISDKAEPPEETFRDIVKNANGLARVGWRLIKNYAVLEKSMNDFQIRFEKAAYDFEATNKDEMSATELIRLYYVMRERLFNGWEVTLINDGYTFIFSALTRAILKRAGFADPNDIFNRLLCGDAKMDSIKPVRSAIEISECIQSTSGLLDALNKILLVEESKRAGLLDELLNDRAYADFSSRFKNHIHLYGDRSAEELKLECVTFRENPMGLVELVVSYAKQKMTQDSLLSRERETKEKTDKEVKEKFLRHPHLYPLFLAALKRARMCIMYRENSRLDRSRAYGIVRTIFRKIGVTLTEMRVFEKEDDVFYLGVEELSALLEGGSLLTDVKSLVSMRRKEYEGFKNRPPVERILVKGSVYFAGIPVKDNASEALDANEKNSRILRGTACAGGEVIAEARIVREPAQARDIHGKVLVAEMTDPGWVFLMLSASALISEKGSVLSHTAIIGRELGIPTVVGVKNATRWIAEGARLRVNGNTGEIEILT